MAEYVVKIFSTTASHFVLVLSELHVITELWRSVPPMGGRIKYRATHHTWL